MNCLQCDIEHPGIYSKNFCGFRCAKNFKKEHPPYYQSCLNCNTQIKIQPPHINRKFCNHRCEQEFKKKKTQEKNKRNCGFCGNVIYSGKYCNWECSGKGRHKERIETKGFHFSEIRQQMKIKCQKCGYDKIPDILHIHHKDRNHSNNDLSNLIVLCPTCHEEDHFLGKDGRFTRMFSDKQRGTKKRIELYCTGCHQRTSPSILFTRHKKCFRKLYGIPKHVEV